ncbi:LIM/homeobox protein Lhx9 [Cichlidogyrus casuarinus]|uniref:LIM/homeobox protein Lhx9 n=1 Tax=Cichlidogyrus casuarinus TaxID=1844966 RepID=A0ABD2QM24_9PLAT
MKPSEEEGEKTISLSDLDRNPVRANNSLPDDPHFLLKPLRSSSPLQELTSGFLLSGLKKPGQMQQFMAMANILQPICFACQCAISDRYSLTLGDGRLWHVTCLKCAECEISLDGEYSCFTREAKIYCRPDYIRLFREERTDEANHQGTRLDQKKEQTEAQKEKMRLCYKCKHSINRNELVFQCPYMMTNEPSKIDFFGKLRVFHIQCFHCVACDRLMRPGDPYRIVEDGPLCIQHELPDPQKQDLFFSSQFVSMTAKDEPGFDMEDGKPPEEGNNIPKKNRKRRGMLPEILDSMYESGGMFCLSNSARQKRMRTSFKHHQLRTMKTYFAINHNPDAKDLKTLSEKTGLSKRVLQVGVYAHVLNRRQVWFQNARAKYRRSVSKHENGGSCNMVRGHSEEGTPRLADLSSEELDDSRSDAISSQTTNSSLRRNQARKRAPSEDDGLLHLMPPADDILNEDHALLSDEEAIYDEDDFYTGSTNLLEHLNSLNYTRAPSSGQNCVTENNFMRYHVM